MEEELNENDLEERLYAMIHHVDGTQADENDQTHDASPRVEEAPRSTVKRYWRTSHNSAYQKVNTPNALTKNSHANRTPANVNKNTPAPVNKTHAAATDDPKPKEEKNDAPESPTAALAILQNTAPQNYTKTVEILEIDDPNKVLELESSDEDEVIEIALPPKPTITIESSDDDEDDVIIQNVKTKDKVKNGSKENKSPNKSNRDVSASPVPSVVSSMSDDFIRGDCIALNISSAQPDNQSFDFSLHGSDLIGGETPSKKKKKKKNKGRLTSTPISENAVHEINTDNIFATPKSKAKNKKPKSKSYTVSEKTIPNPDVYDSDSNQSVIDITKNHDAYVVTDKSFPSTDVYESDSSVTETMRHMGKQLSPQRKTNEDDSSDSNMSPETPSNTPKNVTDKTLVVDLTDDYTTLDSTRIEENIVIGNISGHSDINAYGDSLMNTSSNPEELGKFCSTKVPQILYEDLDFDNLKGKDKVCRRRRYSLTTLRAEMEKFYNESWGGENFNHQEIQKNMSRDKSLWVIDPKDRMPNPPKRRVTCNYCNRVGHRHDTCRLRPPVCHMCGHTGHYEPRCPRKICVNCGSPNFMYSTSCRNCASWRSLQCAACGQPGHPAGHCPDVWRGYHNTIDENMPLEQCGEKPHHQLQCSGCARRGHLAHACRGFRALCALPLHPARVARYRRLYPPSAPPKRRSKSPAKHETHLNKRRNVSEGESRPPKCSETEDRKNSDGENRMRKNSESAEPERAESEAADFIPIGPNRDSRGQVIQDNEVSDTSEVKTSARIYVSFDMMRRFSTPEGRVWLKKNMKEFNVEVRYSNVSSFLTVVGTVGDQEAFHSELRAWSGKADPAKKPEAQNEDPQSENIMPQKKNLVLRRLSTALDSLKGNIGDPKAIFKELTFLQNRHETIKSQKEISPKQLSNNRDHINEMLRKLNMVLLGQAGLAGGAEHLNALHCLQEKVVNTRNTKIPYPLRTEISQHYQTIFTPLPRNDYAELVKKFYSTHPCVMKSDVAMNSPGPKKKKKKKLKIVQQRPVLTPNNAIEEQPVNVAQQQPNKPSRLVKDMTKRLSYLYALLLKASRPSQNQERDMKRLKIAYKILETKNSLCDSEGQTKKQQVEKMKMAWKVQREAKAFLNGKPQKNKKKKLVRE